MLKSNHYFHAVFTPQAFHIHPLNYALGLAAAAEAAGARIFEQTPALSIDVTGVRKRVVTPKGRLRADHVVLAGNVHLGNLVPRISGTLMPVWTYVMTTKPLGGRLESAVTFRGAVSDTDLADNHYRIVGGDRLMWSGRATTWQRDPRSLARALTADIKEVYPQLSGVEIDHVWTGVLGNSLHRMPQLGELSPRIWLASGFGGHGHQHHGDGGRDHRPRDRRGRRHLAAFCPVRAGVVGRRDRPRRRAGALRVVSLQ